MRPRTPESSPEDKSNEQDVVSKIKKTPASWCHDNQQGLKKVMWQTSPKIGADMSGAHEVTNKTMRTFLRHLSQKCLHASSPQSMTNKSDANFPSVRIPEVLACQ